MVVLCGAFLRVGAMLSTVQDNSMGGGYALDTSRSFKGSGLGVILCCDFLREGARVSMTGYKN